MPHTKIESQSLPPRIDYGKIKNRTLECRPPSQPSPKGEGAMELFPLGGNQKGGLKEKEFNKRITNFGTKGTLRKKS